MTFSNFSFKVFLLVPYTQDLYNAMTGKSPFC